MTEKQLCDMAVAMLERSYVPYSHFPVGAALLCKDGTVFTGCNVPNERPWSRQSARGTGTSTPS